MKLFSAAPRIFFCREKNLSAAAQNCFSFRRKYRRVPVPLAQDLLSYLR